MALPPELQLADGALVPLNCREKMDWKLVWACSA
jgi:hypothetical protein